ncbi:hypothetical protein PM8797T_02144 [Gimesia maris DSM 8797]|nr:hypothetical protein PM8797T_02144 [Gimesia maris DSM 8797]
MNSTENDIYSLLESTIRHGQKSTYAGRTVFEKRIKKGSETQIFRATINSDGTVQTFHPLD